MQTVTRKFTFDSGHRVMNEKFKCFNLHGHTYLVEAFWQFQNVESIGYAVDFKEIKRVFGQFLEDYLDHGFIANPEDHTYIGAAELEKSKIWIMSLNGKEYCNPTAENLGKEIFLIADYLVHDACAGLLCNKIILHETPNCYVTTNLTSISSEERTNFHKHRGELIKEFKGEKGDLNYDDRKK